MRLPTRLAATVAATALAASVGLVSAAPATADVSSTSAEPSSSATTATFDSVKISGLKKKQKQKGTNGAVSFNVRIAGSAPESGKLRYQIGAPQVVRLKSKISTGVDPHASRNYGDGLLGANPVKLTIYSTSAPGLYEVRIPVTQVNIATGAEVKKTAKKRFELHSTKKFSRSKTFINSNRWDSRTAAKFSITAPAFQKGAKVTMLYKKKGAKKAVKIATKKLKLKKGDYSSTVKFTTRKLGRSGKITFKFAKVKWAPKYQWTGKITTG